MTGKIASILLNENIPSKNGGKWRNNTIQNMFVNEVYLGTLVQNKSQTIDVTMKKVNKIPEDEWIKYYNNHEHIIDEETFLRVNKRFK